MSHYETYFYSNRYEWTAASASTILDLVLPRIPAVNSALDVGCGVGAWLSVLKDKGVPDIAGFDGAWVEEKLLHIPAEQFHRVDLFEPVQWDRRYDLAVSLEVAEHLPLSRASSFVNDLTRASDFILFSAAIPFQGGYHHINEQWQTYWVELFKEEGYEVRDWVRPRLWNDESIPVWYRENLLLFVAQNRVSELKSAPDGSQDTVLPLDIVHPQMYLPKVDPESIRYGLSLAKRAWKKRREKT